MAKREWGEGGNRRIVVISTPFDAEGVYRHLCYFHHFKTGLTGFYTVLLLVEVVIEVTDVVL